MKTNLKTKPTKTKTKVITLTKRMLTREPYELPTFLRWGGQAAAPAEPDNILYQTPNFEKS